MSDTLEAIQAGQLLGKPQKDHGGIPFVLTPKESNISSLEHLMPAPARKRGLVSFSDLSSFARFVKEHKTGSTHVFASVTTKGAAFVAVMDYHGKADPGWGDFKAQYTCQPTPEWQKWSRCAGESMPQTEFAVFLEDLAEYFRVPTGADIMELVLTLEGKKNVRIESGVRLQNGQQRINYQEDIDLKGGSGTQKGTIDIPQTIEVAIPLFDYAVAWKTSARLRYKIENARVHFAYEIINPHLIIKQAAEDMIKTITAETQLTPFLGSI